MDARWARSGRFVLFGEAPQWCTRVQLIFPTNTKYEEGVISYCRYASLWGWRCQIPGFGGWRGAWTEKCSFIRSDVRLNYLPKLLCSYRDFG